MSISFMMQMQVCARLYAMHLYSHLVIAQALIPRLKPHDLAEYAWGAVVPDIRYLAGMRRRQTHLDIPVVRAWLEHAPELRDFTLGYLAHVLTDERDAAGALYDRVPLRALRRRLPRPPAAALLEAAYSERVVMDTRVSGSYNPLLAGMGIPQALVEPFAQAANRYAAAPTPSMAAEMMAGLGLGRTDSLTPVVSRQRARLERYLGLARWLERHTALRRALIGAVDLNGVTRRIVDDLVKQIDFLEVD
jgi:hypothetical protein